MQPEASRLTPDKESPEAISAECIHSLLDLLNKQRRNKSTKWVSSVVRLRPWGFHSETKYLKLCNLCKASEESLFCKIYDIMFFWPRLSEKQSRFRQGNENLFSFSMFRTQGTAHHSSTIPGRTKLLLSLFMPLQCHLLIPPLKISLQNFTHMLSKTPHRGWNSFQVCSRPEHRHI